MPPLTPDTARHYVIALDQGSFLCAVCQSHFSWRHVTLRHIKSVHLNMRNHRCSFCTATFNEASNKTKHEKRCKMAPVKGYGFRKTV